MPVWMRPFLAGAAIVALLATTVGLVTQAQRAHEADERVGELEAEMEALEAEVRALEGELEATEATGDEEAVGGSGGPFGDVAELLAGGVPGAACLVDPAGGGTEGLLGDSGTDLPEEPAALVEVVADHVADLRELSWAQDVEVDFVDDEELADRLEVLLEEETEDPRLAARERLLTALGAIPAGTDLERLQRELLEDQVAGYYAPDDGELVVRLPDDGRIRPLDRVTLAHELDHALADQALGLPELDEAPYRDDADAALAALAVIEGDATLLMQRWAGEHLSLPQQLSGLLSGDAAGAQAAFAAVPHHLQQELLFPYTAGMGYVCDRMLDGGWAAVDEAYEQPPGTSLEILQPDLEGLEPEAPPTVSAPAGGEELETTTFGAAPLQWLFEAPGGDPSLALEDAAARAATWGGGRVTVWELEDGGTAVGLALVDRGTGPDLCASVTGWHAAAFDEQQRARGEATTVFRGSGPQGTTATAVRCDEQGVRYVTTGDLGTALAMLGS